MLIENVTAHLAVLYPDRDIQALTDRCLEAMEIDGSMSISESDAALWNSDDIVLITYADSIISESRTPLETLKQFVDRHLKEIFSVVHILPFFPYSSDDGFSVIDYSSVNQSHGNWGQLEAVGEHFKIMGDLVLNHCSTRSLWFENFKKEGIPGKISLLQ